MLLYLYVFLELKLRNIFFAEKFGELCCVNPDPIVEQLCENRRNLMRLLSDF